MALTIVSVWPLLLPVRGRLETILIVPLSGRDAAAAAAAGCGARLPRAGRGRGRCAGEAAGDAAGEAAGLAAGERGDAAGEPAARARPPARRRLSSLPRGGGRRPAPRSASAGAAAAGREEQRRGDRQRGQTRERERGSTHSLSPSLGQAEFARQQASDQRVASTSTDDTGSRKVPATAQRPALQTRLMI